MCAQLRVYCVVDRYMSSPRSTWPRSRRRLRRQRQPAGVPRDHAPRARRASACRCRTTATARRTSTWPRPRRLRARRPTLASRCAAAVRVQRPRMLLGVDVGGTFTDAVARRRRAAASRPRRRRRRDDQSEGVLGRRRRRARARRRATPSDVEALRPRDDRGHQRAARGHAARARRWSPPRASRTSSSSAARRAPTSTGCAPPTRRRSCRPSGASARPSAWAPTACCEPLTTRGARSSAVAGARARGRRRLPAARLPPPGARAGARRGARASGCPASTSRSRTRSVGTFREYERARHHRGRRRPVAPAARATCAGCVERARRGGPAGARRDAVQRRRSASARARRARTPRSTVLSGPAGGAAGAACGGRARRASPTRSCFDMGGTSCDVASSRAARCARRRAREVGGRPLALPMVDIHTVGAGGGSIAWRDAGRRAARRARARRAPTPGPPATAAAAPSRR